MYKNFFKTAVRGFLKNKTFSLINIMGLIIGMTACLLILHYANHELSYDDFHKHKENIYRLQLDAYQKGELSRRWAGGPAGIGPGLKESLPEVEAFVKLRGSNTALTYKNKVYNEKRVYYATESFFEIISYELLKGIDSLVLKEPYTMAISESTAKKYFGNEDPMGQSMNLNGHSDFTVTGVFKNPPENTHMKIDILYSFETYVQLSDETARTSWDWWGFPTYVKLKEGTSKKEFELKLAEFIEQKMGDQLRAEEEWIVINLQPITDIHLNSNFISEFEVNGDSTIVYGLLAVAFLIIIIAWLNYINLTTANSMQRGKEIGIRKVMGSSRRQLISQFLFESLALNILAGLVAIILSSSFSSFLDDLIGKPLTSNLYYNNYFLIGFPMFILIGSILSGFYPAFVVAEYKPIETLKGNLAGSSKGKLMRKAIVIFQFALSMILMVGTMTVYKQINFLQDKELGVSIDQILVLKGPNLIDSTYTSKYRAFKTELLRQSSILNVATSSNIPGNSRKTNNAGRVRKADLPETEGRSCRLIDIDYDFIHTYGLALAAGQNFRQHNTSGSPSVLLNETAVRYLGFDNADQAVGEKIFFWGESHEVIGVLKDYHQDSPKGDYQPLVYRPLRDDPSWNTLYSIKLKNTNMQTAIRTINNLFDEFFPGNAFDYYFVDDQYNQQYASEQLFNKLFNLFSGLAVFIACMGLFGLSAFTVMQRMKEVGIRKVLGASMNQIIVLLTTDFARLITISITLGLPISFYLMDKWLQNFAFRTSISWMIFLIPIIFLFGIAVLTVSYQVFKAAVSNPVETLKDE